MKQRIHLMGIKFYKKKLNYFIVISANEVKKKRKFDIITIYEKLLSNWMWQIIQLALNDEYKLRFIFIFIQ